MKRIRFNEGSSGRVVCRFFSSTGQLEVPDSIQYRIDCSDNDEEIRDWTSVTPDSAVAIQLSADDNDTILVNQEIEKHVVTVEATYGAEKVTDSIDYEVRNLRFLP